MIFLAYIELLLFAICAFTVFYLLVYAIAATGNRIIAVLIIMIFLKWFPNFIVKSKRIFDT